MRKVKYILSLVVVSFVTNIIAQPYHEWSFGIGNSGLDQGRSIASDTSGNVYIIGPYSGTVDFDPGIGVFNLTSTGSFDVYIQKLSKSGNLIWAKSIGGTGTELGLSVSIDYSNNILIAGSFTGTADFDPGVGIANMTSFGNTDAFVLKLNSSGNYLWAKQFGGTLADQVWSVSADHSNNVILGGEFRGSGDFDPGPGTLNLTSVGNRDFFIVKLTDMGNLDWAYGAGSTSHDMVHAVSVDANNNILIAGVFESTVDFNYGIGTNNLTSSGNWDAFVQKLDSNGAFVWVKKMGGASDDVALTLSVNTNDDIIVGGYFSGTGTFGGTFLSSAGGNDIFIAKCSSNGSNLWGNRIGGSSNESLKSLISNTNGDIYSTGIFQSTVDFDPGTGVFNMTGTSGEDIFISKLDVSGNFGWALQMSSGGDESGTAITVNKTNIYCTGYFNSTIDLDPAVGVNSTNPVGGFDAFVVRLNECLNTTTSISPSACTSYTSPSGKYTWTTSNTYKDTLQNAGGCDSVITINLTITGPSTGTDVITACNSYTWIDNNTYTASNNTATHTIVNGAANGCDSIVTLNLTINNTATGTDVITACNSYTWIDNNTYNASNNTATHTITNGAANGCDSVVTLNLTINTVDNSTSTQGNDSIMANATGATYQWLDCNNNYAIISGATNQLFVASANGSYAVEVTQNSCTDTSNCVTVSGVGIDELTNLNISVYPNPTTGNVTIELERVLPNITFQVKNVVGQTVETKTYTATNKIEFNLQGDNGIYFLIIENEHTNRVFKILKH